MAVADRGSIRHPFRQSVTARRPGDPLPPSQPLSFIDNVTDAEVLITGSGRERRIVVLFSYEFFPGIRFGHRFRCEPGGETNERIWLKEAIETGALDEMQDPPDPDDAGVIWTTWGDSGASDRSSGV